MPFSRICRISFDLHSKKYCGSPFVTVCHCRNILLLEEHMVPNGRKPGSNGTIAVTSTDFLADCKHFIQVTALFICRWLCCPSHPQVLCCSVCVTICGGYIILTKSLAAAAEGHLILISLCLWSADRGIGSWYLWCGGESAGHA